MRCWSSVGDDTRPTSVVGLRPFAADFMMSTVGAATAGLAVELVALAVAALVLSTGVGVGFLKALALTLRVTCLHVQTD